VILEGVLNGESLAKLRALATTSARIEGAETARGLAASVKHNQHGKLDQGRAQILHQTVIAALQRHPLFFRVALPKFISELAVNRYASGMSYGCHYDLPLQNTAAGERVRADLSATLFLSAPEEYDGGELQIVQEQSTQLFKGKAGDMMLYPSGLLHQVTPVTRGERYAVIFWIQSLIRDHQQRSLLYACDDLVERLSRKLPDGEEVRDLTGLFVNLGRMWIDS
jgi:PKHD-type hydroxylase